MRIPAGIVASLLLALACAAQQSSQNPDQNQNSSQSQNQSKDQADKKSQPDKSQPPEKRRSTAEDNPFPEDISKKAASDAGNPAPDAPAPKPAPNGESDAGKPASPSNSKPDYSSSRSDLRDLDSTDPEARISDGSGGYIHDPKLASQDVKVGQFYFVNQEFKGAYSRFKEATKVDPGNAEAVYGLAEAARALKLNNEAADNYRIYLDAFPDGPKAKSARKALAQLGEAPRK